MRKVLLSVFLVVSFIGYSWQQRHDQSLSKVIVPITAATNPPTSTDQTGQSTSVEDVSSRPGKAGSPLYKDGAYTGNEADAFYGNIQVRVTVSGGKITDIVFLDYPRDRQESELINQQAMPLLKQEAIKAQAGDVDGISGASDTSTAFIESMKAALDQAKQS